MGKNNRLKPFARYGGLVAVAIEWLSLLGFYAANPASFSGQYPLSYFATIPQTRIIFSLCYTLAAVSFWLFVKYHLSRHYQTPTKLFAVSMLGFAAVAIVPFQFDNPVTSTIHNLSAFIFTITFIAGMYEMSRRNPEPAVRRVSATTAALGLILLLLFYTTQRNSHTLLLLEAGTGLACQFWMVWMSLHAVKK